MHHTDRNAHTELAACRHVARIARTRGDRRRDALRTPAWMRGAYYAAATGAWALIGCALLDWLAR